MHSRASLLGLCAVFSGTLACASAGPRGATLVELHDVAAPTATPHVAAPTDAVIVWRRGDAGAIASSLVTADGTVLAARAEAVVVRGGELYALRSNQVAVTLCDCLTCDASGDCEQSGVVNTTATSPFLVPLAGGEGNDIPLVDPPAPGGCATNAMGFDRETDVASLLGSVVVFSVADMDQACNSAHPMWLTSPNAMDVESGALLATSPPDAAMGGLVENAKEDLRAKGEGCILDPDETPRFWAGFPELQASGSIETSYVFTMSAMYMCGTGPDHYSLTSEVKLPGLPGGVEGHFEMPAAFRRVVKSDVVGVSAVIPAARAAAAAKLLTDAPLPAPPS